MVQDIVQHHACQSPYRVIFWANCVKELLIFEYLEEWSGGEFLLRYSYGGQVE